MGVLTLRPFLSHGFYHFKRERKLDPNGRAGYPLGSTVNYSPGIARMPDGDKPAVVTTRDTVWTGCCLATFAYGDGRRFLNERRGGRKSKAGTVDFG